MNDKLTDLYNDLRPGVGSLVHALEQLDAELAAAWESRQSALERPAGQSVDPSANVQLESRQNCPLTSPIPVL